MAQDVKILLKNYNFVRVAVRVGIVLSWPLQCMASAGH